jgi:hypothetical protein
MKSYTRMTRLAQCLPIVILAACATPPPATVNLDGRTCTAGPDLGKAQGLTLEPRNKLTVTLDGAATCFLTSEGAKSVYATFLLPQFTDEYLVTVVSAPIGQGLFSPHLLMLDPQGKVVRELARESFLFHGSGLSAGIRVHSGEHYLIVASDPQSVGASVSRLSEQTHVTTTSTGFAYFSVHTGSDANDTYT